jgi:hypothetical protein
VGNFPKLQKALQAVQQWLELHSMKKQPKHGGDLAAVSGDISLGTLERENHLINTIRVPTESSSISLVSFSSA